MPKAGEISAALAEARPQLLDAAIGGLSADSTHTVVAGEPVKRWALYSFDEHDGDAFDQMTPTGEVLVPLLVDGEVVGTMEMTLDGSSWRYAGTGGDLAVRANDAERLLLEDLGAGAETRVVVGGYYYWAMARSGLREAAVFFSSRLPEFVPESLEGKDAPDPSRVYEGDELLEYLRAL